MSIRGIHLNDLGRPALLQLQTLGIDVTKQLNAKASGIDPKFQLLFKTMDRERVGKYKVSSKEQRTMDGIVFDSKLEMNVYRALRHYNIEFEQQKVFVIEENFEFEGKKHRAIKYLCDFAIIPDSLQLVIDAKGLRTPVFKLKEKLFLKRFGYPITVVSNLNELMLALHKYNLLKSHA